MTRQPDEPSAKAPQRPEEVGYAATMAMDALELPADPASFASTMSDAELPLSPEEMRALMEESGATVPVSAEAAEAMLAKLGAYDENAATAIVSPEQVAAARAQAGLGAAPGSDDGRYTQIEASDKIAQYVEQAKAAQAGYATGPKRGVAPTLAERALSPSQPASAPAAATASKSGNSAILIVAILVVALAIIGGLAFILLVALS